MIYITFSKKKNIQENRLEMTIKSYIIQFSKQHSECDSFKRVFSDSQPLKYAVKHYPISPDWYAKLASS